LNAYADTSVLFALFHPRTEFALPVNARQKKVSADFFYPPWLRFELRHNLNAGRTDQHGEVAWRAMLTAERHRLRGAREDWLEVIQSALDLSMRHGRDHECGAVDVLHVASALALHAEEFWTCDAAQAAFARAAGLKVVDFSKAAMPSQ
jgi:predicted nucleic acid-binding protein